MRKLLSTAAALFLGIISANAAAQAQPLTGTATCRQAADGGGIVTVSGVNVQRFEIYTHLPAPAPVRLAETREGGYYVPRGATFNFVFAGQQGTGFVLVGNDTARASQLLDTGASVPFVGINVMPDAQNGGIGHGGASLVCAHHDKRVPRVVQRPPQ